MRLGKNIRLLALAALIGPICLSPLASAVDLDELIAKVKAVGPEGKGHEDAIKAIAELSAQKPESIPKLLAGMNGANRLAVNWLRSAVESAADKGELPMAAVKSFLNDKSNSSYARRLAFELITERQPDQKNAMLANMLDDPSLEIRRDAVALELTKVKKATDKAQKIKGFQSALQHAREIQQIQSIADSLSELDVKVDLVKHFGMFMDWQLIGPFPNKEQSKFDEVYPPEKSVDLKGSYKGDEDKQVKWAKYESENEEGIVDLNKALSNFKGAIAYAYTEFDNPKEMEVDIRLGCINANKVWINDKLVISNNVYHAGMNLDQYIGKAKLKAGKNKILIKVCQNEQKESWAQRWQFQFRITDSSGKTIALK